MKQINKYITFFGLYIAQSIPMSFFTTVVPVIMRQEYYSLEAIGLLQFVKLPWLLKFLWAPLIDKKANSLGQFKKIIISSELFYAAIILLIGFFNLDADFPLIVVFVVLAVFASATQDIATDALAVLTLKKEQRSMGNAVQSMGGFLGALIGSGVLLIIYNHFGWQALLFGLSGFVLLALVPLRFFRYKITEKPSVGKISLRSLGGFFRQPKMKRHVIFLLIAYSGVSGIMGMVKPYMVDNGFKLGQIGFLSGIVGTATAAIAALVTGLIICRVGIRKAMAITTVAGMAVGIVFLQIHWVPLTPLHIGVALCTMWGAYGMMNVVVYVMAMDWVRPGFEGTDFTIQIVISQLGSLLIAGMSGFITRMINYQGLFLLEIILALIVLFYSLFYYHYRNEHID